MKAALLLFAKQKHDSRQGLSRTLLPSAAFEGQPPRVPELLMGIRLELEPRPEAGYQARDEVGDLLRDQVDDGVLIDLQLIVSELVTSAFRTPVSCSASE